MLLMGQAGPAQPQYVSWGPPKAGVVNIFDPAGLTVPASGSVLVYQVPQDRWLTVTAMGGSTSCGTMLRVAEEYSGALLEKGFLDGSGIANGGLDGRDAVGWVFRPGSRVMIVNAATVPCPYLHLQIIGYQTRD